jgi:hypothetical protein
MLELHLEDEAGLIRVEDVDRNGRVRSQRARRGQLPRGSEAPGSGRTAASAAVGSLESSDRTSGARADTFGSGTTRTRSGRYRALWAHTPPEREQRQSAACAPRSSIELERVDHDRARIELGRPRRVVRVEEDRARRVVLQEQVRVRRLVVERRLDGRVE